MTPRPLVIAHRGASAARPENTVEAFRHARQLGADWVELDARRAADGSVWVLHDDHLADGRVLATLHPDELPAEVPSLHEALEACEGMGINIEIKNVPIDKDYDPTEVVAARTVELVRELDLHDRVLVSSFSMDTVDAVRGADGRIETAWLTVHEVDEVALRRVADRGHAAVHPHEMAVDAGAVQRARSVGLRLNTWTTDDPDRIRAQVELGVDGICTNVPDVARQVIDEIHEGAARP